MTRSTARPARGDAAARRHIAQWRRITARLQVLVNTGSGAAVLADEAHALRRQCERLAAELGQVLHQRYPGRSVGPGAGQ